MSTAHKRRIRHADNLTATEVIDYLRASLADELAHLSCSVELHRKTVCIKAVALADRIESQS